MGNFLELLSKNNSLITYILISIGFVWLGVLSFSAAKRKKQYDSMFGNSSGKELKNLLEDYLHEVRDVCGKYDDQQKCIQAIQQESRKYIQKIGFSRFNPFQETGGDQSFILALMDNNDDGVVITSLHGRTQTRIFAKSITNGKADQNSFSSEEAETVGKAQKNLPD